MIAPFAFRGTSVSIPSGGGVNHSLSNLTCSGGAIAPVFASGTLNYTLSVANGVPSVTVVPTGTVSQSITVNGQPVASGATSGSINLDVGTNTISIVVRDGSTSSTYTIAVTRAAGTASALPPNPTLFNFTFTNSNSMSLSISNPNNAAMSVTFDAWPTIQNNATKVIWDSVFPLTVPANQTVQLSAHRVVHSFPTTGIATQGTWTCGAETGALQANSKI